MEVKKGSDKEVILSRLEETLGRLRKNKGITLFRLYKLVFSIKGLGRIYRLSKTILHYFIQLITNNSTLFHSDYNDWIKKNTLSKKQVEKIKSVLTSSTSTKFSIIIIPSDSGDENVLTSFSSLEKQSYSNWELIIFSLKEDGNIVFNEKVKKGEGLFQQSYLEQLAGDYVLFLKEGDELEKDALLKFAHLIGQSGKTEMIYSDHDLLNANNERYSPSFKPDWSPDTLLGQDYIGTTVLYKKSVLLKIGTLLPTSDALYDLCLKASELVIDVKHIDDVLFHLRNEINVSRPPKDIIESAMLRRGEPGKVEASQQNEVSYTLHYDIKKEGKVSIIIPTKNLADVTEVCIKSIFDLTSYPFFEVILIDNNSSEDSLFELVNRWENKEPNRFKCIKDSSDFNFARLMNFGVSEASGDYILLLNNDTEVLKADWMTCLVEQAQRESVGVVGVKLIYSNDTVQHAGVLMGFGGIVGHCFVGFQPEGESALNSLTSVRNYSGITAACFMSSKEKYLSVGGFDENLAIEYNDIDFCLKLLEKGYNNIYLPHVSLYHYESISRGHPFSTRKSYNQSMKEQNYFYGKWSKYSIRDPYYNRNLSLVYDDFRLKIND